MDEAGFRAAFSAKVDVAAAMARVFRQEPLDFVLFFSALTGFFKPEGQSNYAAGCTFQDALAHRLAQEWTSTDGRPAIKVMNWGYWGHVGVVASQGLPRSHRPCRHRLYRATRGHACARNPARSAGAPDGSVENHGGRR